MTVKTVMLLRIQVFWNVTVSPAQTTVCSSPSILLDPYEERTTLL